MARTRNTKPRPKRTLLSHFRDKKLVAPKPTPRSTPAPTMSPTTAPTPAPTPTMNTSPKAPHVRTLFPGREQIIEGFFAGLDVEKILQKYRIPSFVIMKTLEKHQSKILKAKSRMGPKGQIEHKS